jgi:hypothetical protein
MDKVKMLIVPIVAGIVLTLLTGLFENTPGMLVGATHYGYPLAWLTRLIIAPEYYPWQVNPFELIADIVIWAVIVWVILFIVVKLRK